MKHNQRIACILAATFFIIVYLILRKCIHTSHDEYPLKSTIYPPANQTLHQEIHQQSLKEMIIQSPSFSFPFQLLILSPSIAHNLTERTEVRRVWANPTKSTAIKNRSVRLIFCIGTLPQNNKDNITQHDLQIESEKHNDLLQVGIEESYMNLVHKLSISFLWATSSEGPKVKYILKSDTDVIVHVDRLMQHIPLLEKEKTMDVLWCAVLDYVQVARDQRSKWFVSESSFNRSMYPPYCSGPSYMGRRETFQKIVQGSGKRMVINPEDAFFTGIVAEEVGVERRCANSHMAFRYTTYSHCSHGIPSLSIVALDGQFTVKGQFNVEEGWERAFRDTKCDGIIRSLLRTLDYYINRDHCISYNFP